MTTMYNVKIYGVSFKLTKEELYSLTAKRSFYVPMWCIDEGIEKANNGEKYTTSCISQYGKTRISKVITIELA